MSSLAQGPHHERAALRPRVGDVDHRHRMRPLGYVRRSQGTRMDCEQPMRFVCRTPACGHQAYARCKCADELKCPDCAERNQKLLVRLIVEGHGRRGAAGHWYMVTLTAPGDPEHRKFIPGKRGNHGPCSCGQHGLTPGEWNALESKWWNRLRTALVREFGSLAYVGTVEVQEERVDHMLHRHLLVWSPVPIPIERAHELVQAAGYGCSMQWQKPYSAQSAAQYVAKYITKSSGRRFTVPWEVSSLDQETGEISTVEKRATYRTWSKSNRWGVTMQGLRSIMAAQAQARAMYLRELAEMLADDQESPPLAAVASSDPPT